MKVVIAFVVGLCIVSLGAIIILGLYLGYDASVYFLASHTASLNRITEIRALFTPVVYKYTLAFAAFYLGLFSLILVRYHRIYPVVQAIGQAITASISYRIKRDWSGKLFILLIIPIAAAIYYTIRMPISIDEAYTYTYFSSRSILVCMSYYSAPNNHILYSILENLCLRLPLPDLVCMRIPAIIGGIGCVLFLYSFVKEYYNETVAFIAAAIFPVLTMSVYYSYMARGYSLECLFFILMTYAVFKIYERPESKVYWLYFCISSILGFYTIPSFLYPYIIGNIALLAVTRRVPVRHVISVVLTLAVTAVLYLPVVLVNGLDALIHNNVVAPTARAVVMTRLPGFLRHAYEDISGLPAIAIGLIITAGVIISLWRYRGMTRYYLGLVIVVTPLLLLIHGVIPFSRTIQYHNVIIALGAGLAINALVGRFVSRLYGYAALLLLQCGMIYHANKQIMAMEEYSLVTHEVVPLLRSGRHFYVHSFGFDLYLNFYFRERRIHDYDIHLEPDLTIRSDMDTMPAGIYGYCIAEHANDMTRYKTPAIRTNFYSIYK